MNKVSPILKWAGGKRQLLPQIMPLIPDDINRYFEPFVGAGAVLFELQPKRAIVNDANTELINVYVVIRDHCEELITLLRSFECKHSEKFFYEIRSLDRDDAIFGNLSSIEKAARTIYLNRTCYNGLYRVNKAGFFNTPLGHNTSIQIVNDDGIRAISRYLNANEVRLLNGNYQQALKGMRKTDFVFLDPPYYPIKKDYFTRYDASPFGVEEQIELKTFCDRLTQREIRFLQTNSNCEEIKELYFDYNLEEVDVRRSINANANGRKGTELIIKNY